MRLSPVFSVYVGRQYLLWFLAVFAILTGIVLLVDCVELLRRASSRDGVSLGAVITMSVLKLPHLALKLISFAVLFGAILTFWRLNRSYELVVARAAGVSAWQFLLPALVLALVIGSAKTALFNPLAATLLQRYERLEGRLFRGGASQVNLSGTGLWLRETTADGHAIVHARRLQPRTMQLEQITIFEFTGADRFVGRIDAPTAWLEDGHWRIQEARITRPGVPPQQVPEIRLTTDMTAQRIHNSFTSPDGIPFWELPHFIGVLEKAGFSGVRHRLQFHTLLADPLLSCAMVLIAASFTLRPVRRGGVGFMIACGAGVSFAIYFASDLVYALGLSDRLPVMLSAWTPAAVTLSIGLALMFHLEDG